MSSNTAIAFVDRQHWLDSVAEALQPAIREAFAAGGAVGQSLQNFLHGTWLGHPLHPVITDVPVCAWTSTFVLDTAATVTEETAPDNPDPYGRAKRDAESLLASATTRGRMRRCRRFMRRRGGRAGIR